MKASKIGTRAHSGRIEVYNVSKKQNELFLDYKKFH